MRRGLVHVLAWLLATGAAVTLSWWGVHTVMAGTAYDPPRALPITAAGATTQESGPVSSSTRRPTDAKAPEAADDAADAGDSKDARDPKGSKDSKDSKDQQSSRDSEDTAADARERESSGRSAGEPDGGSPDPAPGGADPTPPGPAPVTSGEVKAYDTDGGRAVFDLGETSASLVSATPGAGWSMQVWKTESWIRVEFAADADRVSVFCTWHDGPPRVEINDY
ncbi:hypothetical protein DIZ27_25720 [Streptomyces sp. NWU339]|uniref:hypothetical protein n=1 Tax=Streptomyces sp. NWU339 TaxID=2185284 RepID=UPI000D673295|nr:hypothetical protein [Streptomyces sp. NWU339]PWI07835.1 hypothetical protein DIZ27_25720 [Streptomyces sp. NWU339]